MNNITINNPLSNIKKHLIKIDWFLVVTVCIAVSYGIVLVKSTTNYMNTVKPLTVQVAAVIMGIGGMFFMSTIDYEHALKYTKIYYAMAILMILSTFVLGTGEEETGSSRWIRVGGVGIQPTEIAKILFITTFSKHLDSVKNKLNFKNVMMLLLHFGTIFVIVFLQGDLGSALVFAFIFVVLCFVAGVSLWYFLGAIFVVVTTSPLLWNLLADYQKDRLLIGFKPESDPLGKGFQVLQSRTAIGSGGIFGYGFQKGPMTQRISGKVPFQYTDFIFSAAGEEFGIFGTLLIIALLAVIIVRIFIVARKARNEAGSFICMGVFAMFVFQAIENIGMCMAILPVTGITLPFFSYGGSSVLTSLLAIGLVLSVYSHRQIYYFNQDNDNNATINW